MFTAVLVRSPAACFTFMAGVTMLAAGLIPTFLVDGGRGLQEYIGGGLLGVVIPISGLLLYGQFVWWRTGSWPKPWGRRRTSRTAHATPPVKGGHPEYDGEEP